MKTAVWRLIVDERVDGAANMALDRAVLSCRSEGLVRATLRLYRWQVPTVTLGRFQKVNTVDLAACERRGFDVARRPTGGRGVLHDDELTYAVVAALSDGVPQGTAGSYAHLCAALARAYRELGVSAELTARSRGERDSAACYLHTTSADLSLGAAKLSGSAQVWRGDAVLQHGSVVVSRDATAEAQVFRLDERGKGALVQRTATLSGAVGRRPTAEEIAAAVIEAFEAELGVRLEPGSLCDEERSRAAAWVPEHSILRSARAVERSRR